MSYGRIQVNFKARPAGSVRYLLKSNTQSQSIFGTGPNGADRYRPKRHSQSQSILKLPPNGAIRYSPNLNSQSQSILRLASRCVFRTGAARSLSVNRNPFLGPVRQLPNPGFEPQLRRPCAAYSKPALQKRLPLSTSVYFCLPYSTFLYSTVRSYSYRELDISGQRWPGANRERSR